MSARHDRWVQLTTELTDDEIAVVEQAEVYMADDDSRPTPSTEVRIAAFSAAAAAS